jgi:anti-sigma factor RsiW
MNHPDWNAMAAFLDGRLPPKERANFLRHLLACRACRREVHEASSLRAAWEQTVDAEAAQTAAVAGPAKALVRFPVRLCPPRAQAPR